MIWAVPLAVIFLATVFFAAAITGILAAIPHKGHGQHAPGRTDSSNDNGGQE